MTPPEIKRTVPEVLPQLIAEDPLGRDFLLRTVSNYYASREETESRFDRVLAELQRDRKEQNSGQIMGLLVRGCLCRRPARPGQLAH